QPQSPYTPNFDPWYSPPGMPPSPGMPPPPGMLPPPGAFPGYAPPPPLTGWGPQNPILTYHDHLNHTGNIHFAECAEIWDRYNKQNGLDVILTTYPVFD
ncbi:hypothetical protein MPER_00769, partial [Moniliophthora perniciosa FA553]